MHFGIISPPVPGHIHPFGALGRELIERGHRVTFIHMEDVRERVFAENLEFIPIGASDHPPGSLPESLALLGKLDGLAALRFTVKAVRKTTEMFCRDAPIAIQNAGIEALLVDQTEPAGASIAELLGIPFLTVCNALNLNEEPDVPPPFSPWACGNSAWARARNRIGYGASRVVMSPLHRVIDAYRLKWGLAKYRDVEDSFSRLAQISQLPAAFDYPRKRLPQNFYYVGPLRKPKPVEIPFPWGALDGRPLIYSSLGTLQNGRERVFRIFAEACSTLPVQLVIAGMDLKNAYDLPGNTLAVSYAPQLQVLAKASLTLTHGGLNTVLDSLSCGVPAVVMPINYEQPAIAERVRWTGAGEVIRFRSLTPGKLREAILAVMQNSSCIESARRLAVSIDQAGGVRKAGDIVEAATRSALTV